MTITVELAELQSIQDLDTDALAAIFDRYASTIYKYAFRLCRDPLEADQIVGDVFYALLERLAAGKGPHTNLRAYLFQIAYHIVVDHARERQRTVPIDDALSVRSAISLPSQVEDQLLLEALSSAIQNDLTDEQRQVVILRFQENFSLRETAEILGKDVNAIKALENRGIKKLRQILDKLHVENWP